MELDKYKQMRWEPVPDDVYDNTTTGTGIRGVWLQPNEVVEWHFVHYPNGKRSVYGYTIHRKYKPDGSPAIDIE